MPLLPKFEISSLDPSSLAVQPGLGRTWWETPKTGFLATGLIYIYIQICCILLNIFKSYETRHEKTGLLHMGKQRRRSAATAQLISAIFFAT